MDDIKVLKEIRNGKALSEFGDQITPLMALAAMDSRDAYKELPENMRNRRFAKMAVRRNFRNIELIPADDKMHCGPAYASWLRNLTRADLDDYSKLLNAQSPEFIKSALRQEPGLMRFIKKTKNKDNTQSDDTFNRAKSAVLNNHKKKPATEHFYIDQDEFSTYDFSQDEELGCADELNPEAYLARPVALQTKEDLDELLQIPDKFPPDFIYRLQLPYKNAAFYEAQNDITKATEWKSRQIPWLNRSVCEHIACIHPEASIKTPAYLKKEYITAFWNWAKEGNYSKQAMTEYFLLFPEEMLTEDMLDDVEITWQVLRHAPTMLTGSEKARIYLNKHPNDIFRLPESYQTVTKLITDGTTLSPATLPLIKNETIRACIAAALGLDEGE